MADSLALQFEKLVVKWIQVEDSSRWVAEGPILPPPRAHMPDKAPSHIQCPQVGAVPPPSLSSAQLTEPAGRADDSGPFEHPWRNPNPITELLRWHKAGTVSSQFHHSVLKVR